MTTLGVSHKILITTTLLLGIVNITLNVNGQYYSFFSGFRIVPYIGLILITIIAFKLELKQFSKEKSFRAFFTSITGLILILTVSTQKIVTYSIDSSESIFEISGIPGPNNVISIDLKESGNYVLTEIDMFGSSYFYGKYSIIENEIQILNEHKSNNGTQFPSSGIIKDDTVYWNNFDKMIITEIK